MKRTNYFGRFENKSAYAEDRLTRAFLVLLRLVPPVQAAFIDAIRGTHQEEGNDSVVPSRTATDEGVSGVWSQVGTLRTDEGRVLSILLTNREWKGEVEFFETDRSTVNVCSGVSLQYRWDRPRALDLDDNDRLTNKIDERVREAVRAWGAEAEWMQIIQENRLIGVSSRCAPID